MSVRRSRNDLETFRKLLNFSDTVFRICLGFTQNHWEAEDLSQEAYFRAFKRIHTLNNSNRSREWLFRIARNTCLNHLKKKRLGHVLRWNLHSDFVVQNSPESTLIKLEQSRNFKRAVSQLPKKHRDVFVLKEYAHLSYQEIASALGLKKGTVMSRLHRARTSISAQLKEVDHAKK